MDKKRAIAGLTLSFVFLALFIYAISGISWFFKNSIKVQQSEVFLGSVSESIGGASTQDMTSKDVTSSPPEILAKSVVSVRTSLAGADTTVFEKSPDLKLPIASLTKLMTAIIVLDNYDLSGIVEISSAANAQDSIKQDVKLGDRLSAENLLKIMLVGSSNKSAYALAEQVGVEKFVQAMNDKAKDIGMNDTSYADPTGLSSKNVSTANDLVKLSKYILEKYPKIAQISKMQELSVPGFGTITNTDQLLGEISEVVCSKTGFTTQAKGCLLLVVNNSETGDYLINVVLGADDRFSEMRKIINWSSSVCNLN